MLYAGHDLLGCGEEEQGEVDVEAPGLAEDPFKAHVLRAGRLYWTERALLWLVESIAWRRLEQLEAVSASRGRGSSTWVDESDMGDKS